MRELRHQLSLPEKQKDSHAGPDHTLLQQQRESRTGESANFSTQLGRVGRVTDGERSTHTRTLANGARRLLF